MLIINIIAIIALVILGLKSITFISIITEVIFVALLLITVYMCMAFVGTSNRGEPLKKKMLKKGEEHAFIVFCQPEDLVYTIILSNGKSHPLELEKSDPKLEKSEIYYLNEEYKIIKGVKKS